MTNRPRHASTRATSTRLRVLVILAAFLCVVLSGGIAVAKLGSDQSCPNGRTPLRVAVSPDLAPAATAVTTRLDPEARCLDLRLQPTSAADVVSQLNQGLVEPPDVWIPESSLWLTRGTTDRVIPAAAGAASVATSPLVLAISATTAAQLAPAADRPAVADLVGPGATSRPVAVRLSDQPLSPARVGTVLALQSAVQGRDDARAALTQMLRAAEVTNADTEQLVELTAGDSVAIPVPEQTVWAANTATGTNQTPAVVAVYPGGYAFDYPFAVLTEDDSRQAAADILLKALQSDAGQAELRAAGFRDLSSRAGDGLTPAMGVDPGRPVEQQPIDSATTEQAERTLRLLRTDARLLAVIDVSGSMAKEVPGSGGATRLQLAAQAATEGLGLYPDGTDVGLWVFATDLGDAGDHREVLPIRRVGGPADRQRLATALAEVAVAQGDTALYDTALAAVREVRQRWSAEKVNAVVLLSDGEDTDDDSIGLDGLLQTLQTENDPARPVPVITIAYGPEAGADVLARISEATGGATYTATDPRQIRQVFLDAVGQRVCRPDCVPSPVG
ncbi:MAG: substrate-binding domain-containing protein [Candidatus Nanopelagicales bacterium]